MQPRRHTPRRGQYSPRTSGRSADTTLAGVRRHRPDYWILILMVAMLAIGLVVVYAISPALGESSHASGSYFVVKQLIAIGLSLLAFAITSRLPVGVWKQISRPLLIIAGLATLLAIVMPVNPHYPAHRWVRLGSLSFQSVEIVKFALLVWLAGFLAQAMKQGSMDNFQKLFKPFLIVLGIAGAFVAGIQSDLGSTGVIVAVMGIMAFVAGLPLKRIMLVLAVIAIGTLLFVAAVPYRRERLLAFTHPTDASCQNSSGYQACQALIAVGSGGMVGLGLGKSVQAYGYLPEAANDSIFAIYAEKFGFLGCVMLLGVLATFFYRLKTVAERIPDDFSRLLVVGILTWLSVQAFINIGAMIGLLPLKGITLPFISYGGTSVVFSAAAVGVVFQISRYTNFTSPLEGRRRRRSENDYTGYGRRLGRSHHTRFSGR